MDTTRTPDARLPSADDFLASLVVFLVALPLCMGIAIASGVPPALGLITGIVGGLVVGFIGGAPLQVSGPAAGLTVLVWQLVQDYGLGALGLAVLLGGALQLGAGLMGLGRWFRAVSPAVIHGMLAGIGVLIFSSQFHVMLDHAPIGGGLANLLGIPRAIVDSFGEEGISNGASHHWAALCGALTIVSLLLWASFAPRRLRLLPGPLVGAVAGSAAAAFMAFDIKMVSVPENLLDAATWVSLGQLPLLREPGFVVDVLGLALIASAETLLCATAVDKMHRGPRADYDKELRGQGVGNMLCGVVGALPMTGVIVRSSANIDAGGKTRWSAILHGAWLLGFTVAVPFALEVIPLSVLAAILVYTGYKLVNVSHIRNLSRLGRGELLVYAVTLVGIVVTDLLTGVVLGLVLSLIRTLLSVSHLSIRIDPVEVDGRPETHVRLEGAATVFTLPKLAAAIDTIPRGKRVVFHVDRLAFIDHACLELIEDFHRGASGHSPHDVELDLGTLHGRYRAPSYENGHSRKEAPAA